MECHHLIARLGTFNNRSDKWRLTLEGKNYYILYIFILRISRNKIEYIEYNFGGKYQEFEGIRRPLIISGNVIGEVKNFKYLG
jgi:hypothetical protein